MAAKSSLDGSTTVVRSFLVNLHYRMQPTRAARRDGHVGATADLADSRINGRLFGHTHQQFVPQLARQKRLVNGIETVGNAVDFNHRPGPHKVHSLGQVYKRSLGGGGVGQSPLQHQFAIGRDVKRDCLAGDNLQRSQRVSNR